MSPSRLEISDHAAGRLRERQISRQAVRNCLAQGTLVGLDIGGRLVRTLTVGRRTLVVVYLEVKGGALVVTAYWRD